MIPGSANPLLLATAAPTGYTIERSLRFNSADSAYLSRVFGSPTNQIKFTFSTWVKRSTLGGLQRLLTGGNADYSDSTIAIASDNTIFFAAYNGTNALTGQLVTSQVFRDTGAWFHLVAVYDSANGTAADRMQLYVNGVRITAFTTQTNPPQNAIAHRLNTSGATHYIGSSRGISDYFSGYLADIHFIDGQALTPTSFGEFDVNNVWQPKAFSGGSYGTNGFKLNFSNNSAATAAALGADSSGNGNHWTPTNLSVTAGAGNDSLVDSPTNYGTDTGVGAEVRGNYCTLNPLTGTGTKANGNLEVTGSGCFSTATISPPSGKWYWEVTAGTISGDVWFGIYGNPNTVSSYVLWGTAGSASTAGGTASFSSNTIVAGDIIGCAWNMDTSTLQFYRNGSSVGTQSGFTLTGSWHPGIHLFGGTASSPYIFNFGQRPFAFPVSGFKALCTANLPTPTIANGATAMDVALWTGNGSARSITGLSFNPDLVWIKSRSAATDHAFYDVVRGTERRLESNNTDAEVTSDGGVTAFNSDGFSLGTLAQVNTNSATYAGWAFDAGSSTVTNTSGSISSQVRASTTNGCSVVTYTGTGANATVGHGLGVAPGLVIVKRRNVASNWQVRHTSIAAANSIQLNLTDSAAAATTVWNSTAPTSTVFSIGTDATVNASGGTYVAYCFAPVAGYSAFGSYTGNGNADGPFVYTGFRPRWILIKNTVDPFDGGSLFNSHSWVIWDTARNSFNTSDKYLGANKADSEVTSARIDILSSGFKLRASATDVNQSGNSHIYAAFAEHPFSASRAR